MARRAGILLWPAAAQKAYDRLPGEYKLGVDLVLEMRNSRAGVKHLSLFFKSMLQSDIQPGDGVIYIYRKFYLKETQCRNGTVDTSNCLFRGKKPKIDCAICYQTFDGGIRPSPKPYVHCIRKAALTKAMTRVRENHCNYSSGAPVWLAGTGDIFSEGY